jgi:hypothetical protein
MGLHTIPPQSIAANSSATVIVSCQPCDVGDSAIVSPRSPAAPFANVIWHAWVSAANQVTIKLTNAGTSTATTAAQQFDLRVLPNH